MAINDFDIRVVDIPDYERLLSPAQKKRGLKTALRKANRHFQTRASVSIRARYAVKAADIKKNIFMFQPRDFDKGAQSLAVVSKRKITSRTVTVGGTKKSGGWARVKKGGRMRFPHAFVLIKGGKKVLRQRKGRARYPIFDPVKALGITYVKMLDPDLPQILFSTRRLFLDNALHEIRRRAGRR